MLKSIENATVKHCKQRLLSRLMEDVDRDVLRQKGIRLAVKSELEQLVAAEVERQLGVLTAAQRMTYHAETVVTGSAGPTPVSTDDANKRLTTLSGSLMPHNPITARLLRDYAVRLEHGELPSVEADVDEPFDDWKPESGVCLRCGEATSIENAWCAECDAVPELPDDAESNEDGTYAIYREVWLYKEPDTEQISCERCQSERFEVEREEMCDYCKHMFEKVMRE